MLLSIKGLTVRGENSLRQPTVVSPAAPVIKHAGDPVTQSKERDRREVQPGQNLLPAVVRCAGQEEALKTQRLIVVNL